jgi:molecular chaperone GrpE
MHRIPIHIESSTGESSSPGEPSSAELESESVETRSSADRDHPADRVHPADERHSDEQSIEVWRDRALRLQAEIENYRKRQRRLAAEEIAGERKRLLDAFAHVADDLRRALDAGESDVKGLREGVALTYRNLVYLLDREGVKPIEAQGERFNPALHEAVATVPHAEAGVQPQTVIEVTERGYTMGDRLLRPARVIVAV